MNSYSTMPVPHLCLSVITISQLLHFLLEYMGFTKGTESFSSPDGTVAFNLLTINHACMYDGGLITAICIIFDLPPWLVVFSVYIFVLYPIHISNKCSSIHIPAHSPCSVTLPLWSNPTNVDGNNWFWIHPG